MKSFSDIASLSEEESDKMKDRQLERGGMGARSRNKAPIGAPNTFGKKPGQKYDGMSALEKVKASIRAKHGDKAIKEEEGPFIEPKDGIANEGNKPGLWANIHAKRKRGEKPAKKGSKDYPKTLEVEGYAPGDVDKKVGAVSMISKQDASDAKARILAKTKAKRAAKLQKESLWNQVDIFAELNDWEVSLLSDTLIEEIVAEVFVEEMAEGRDIDSVSNMLCESVDYSLSLLTEVTSPAKVNALRLKDKASAASGEGQSAGKDAGAEARSRIGSGSSSRSDKLSKVKSAAKKIGSALKSGLKTGAKLARKGAVKGAAVAGKAAGHAKNLAKDMGSAAKSGYNSTQSSSSSSDSSSDSSSSSSSDSSSSSSDSGPKKPGLLSRIGSKLKRGIKKAVGAGARSLSRGARNVARKLGEESITERADMWHPDPEKDKKLGGPGANARAREDRADAAKPKADPKKLKSGESYMDYSKRQKAAKSGTATSRLNKLGANIKPKERKRDKIGKAIGKALDKIGGIKREEVSTLSFGAFLAEGNRTGRMMQKSKTQVTGHISADRGSDEKKNRDGRKGLEKDMKKHGIGHKKGVGEYKYDSGETGREVSYQTSKPDKMSKRRFGKVMRRMGRKHGQESVITKDKDKSAKLHYTEKGSKAKSDSIGKTKAGKHPEGYGETSGTKARSGKLPKKTTKGAYHYG
jgi:hypothetical protein